MKIILCLVTLYGLIFVTPAAPLDESARAHILRSDYEVDVNEYDFSFESSDGIERKESGELEDIGNGQKALIVDGYAIWIAPDGKQYRLDYVADEKGFHPRGDHLPNLKPGHAYQIN